MFTEPSNVAQKSGWIEVVCGSMFSGKTEELIRRLKRAKIAHQEVGIFKPLLDNRYHENNIVSHNETTISAKAVADAKNILEWSDAFGVIGIDEAQFFGDEASDLAGVPAS